MKRTVTIAQDDQEPELPVDHDAPRTLSEIAYRKLRSDIVWGVVAPGAPLRSDELRAAYGVGVSPLREALSRLVVERLVVSVGQRGFRVAPITASSVIDVMETRLVIERAALARSIREGGLPWETRIVASYHGLKRVPIPRSADDGQAETWASHHRAFHMALVSCCNSEWQIHLAGLLFDQAERFRLVRATRVSASDISRDTANEHQVIVDATLARDVEGAVKALESHYRSTTKEVLAHIAEAGEQPDE